MNMQEIAPSPLTRELLTESGRLDRKAGKQLYDGWREIAAELGFNPLNRTPAFEAYADGFYDVR